MRAVILTGVLCGVLCASLGTLAPAAEEALPFSHKVEVYRDKEGDIVVFTVRLEQPFLAEEFEKSNYLRLKPADSRAYLIYPKETKFEQKHAEFYGRLRGEGKVPLVLSYEMVSENPDGSRQVKMRQGTIQVTVPAGPTGPRSIYVNWAGQQNLYFANLLRYYPEATFYQYCLLQSRDRYGVTPPPIPRRAAAGDELETGLYQVFTGSTAIQSSFQRATLSEGVGRPGELDTPVGTLVPPSLRSLDFEALLKQKKERDGVEPAPHELARLVPADQYFVHFNSLRPLTELLDLMSQWDDGLLRLFTVRAQDNQVRAKLEDQLCFRREPLAKLFADGALSEVAATGSDPFVMEGTDVTMILRVKKPEVFRKAAEGWVAEVAKKYPETVRREFNYREHKVVAHYTTDRVVSSFVTEHGDCVIFSNSHRAVRRVIDVAVGLSPALHASADYRYVTTVLPPSKAADSGYLFVPQAMIRRLVGPEAKISEKRRMQCLGNLVMLNNASLFYRLEYGRSPKTLSDLVEGRFIDPAKIVCPHGGAYAFDAAHDTCTCSLHNRLKHLTPNVELSVLNVSRAEAQEYERYKQRYAAFWQEEFNPYAVRATIDGRVKLEACLLPLANGSLYDNLRGMVDKNPKPIATERFAPSAVASLVMVPGRKAVGESLRSIPGVTEVLRANPTLTDLGWLGDRVGVHFCDGATILQIDPTQLRQLKLPMLGDVPLEMQTTAGALVSALNLPVYVTIDVENRQNAALLLEKLSQQIFLKKDDLFGLPTRLDAYRLPEYKQHPVYVFSGQVYAIKIRLHCALVGDQLVLATRPEVLREVIDAATAAATRPPVEAHVLVRLNRRALKRLYDDVQLYWEEKARTACHRNIISIYMLKKLYDVPVDEIPRLSDAKYGVRYFCPDHGEYSYDAERDQVLCSVHGNRENSRQTPPPGRKSAFSEFIESTDEVIGYLRFGQDAAIATLEIVRPAKEKK